MGDRHASSLLLLLLIQVLLERPLRENRRRLVLLEHLREVLRLLILRRVVRMPNQRFPRIQIYLAGSLRLY